MTTFDVYRETTGSILGEHREPVARDLTGPRVAEFFAQKEAAHANGSWRPTATGPRVRVFEHVDEEGTRVTYTAEVAQEGECDT